MYAFTISFAVKSALSKIEGGTQAFNKLAQANKRMKDLESRMPDLEKKAALLDKLESIKHDPMEIIKIATGKDPEQFLAEAMRKQRILETGSDGNFVAMELFS